MVTSEEFECWLFEMDDAIESFLGLLPTATRKRLDYSRESLSCIEEWVLSRFQVPEELLKHDNAGILDGLARYVGETFRRILGGKWTIVLDEPDYAFVGMPELDGPELGGTPLAPHALVSAAVDRRSGEYLSGVLGGYLRRVGPK